MTTEAQTEAETLNELTAAILEAADILAKTFPERTLRGENQTPEWRAYERLVFAASKIPILERLQSENAELRAKLEDLSNVDISPENIAP